MNVHADLSFVAMVTNASFIVQAVMALLAVLSLWSWWQIFQKLFQLSAAKREADRFEDEFWKGGDLAELFQKASPSRSGGEASARVPTATLARATPGAAAACPPEAG